MTSFLKKQKWIKTFHSNLLYFLEFKFRIVYTLFRAAQIGQPNAKEFMPTIDMMKLPAGTDIMSVLGDEKMAQKILQKQNQVVRLSGIKLYKALKGYVMSHDELVANNYPLPSKEAKKVATRNNMTEIKKKTTGQSEKRICVRCGKEFFIRKETGEVTGGECAYHAGEGFRGD